VLFTTAAALITNLTRALAEGRLDDKLKLYTVPRVLIVDEIGYLPIDTAAAPISSSSSSAGVTSAAR
jgi:DNA replication protein DnaC